MSVVPKSRNSALLGKVEATVKWSYISEQASEEVVLKGDEGP